MSIDPNDAPEGYIASGLVDNVINCRGCWFFMHGACPVRSARLQCVAGNRGDQQDVIFVRKEQRVD